MTESRFHRRTHTVHVRLTGADRERLQVDARAGEQRLIDLIRHYISTGLRAEGRPPLEPVLFRGRPPGARNRKATQ